MFVSQMRCYVLFFPLFSLLQEQVTLGSRIIPVQSEREREHPPLCQDLDLNPWSFNYEPSVLSFRPWCRTWPKPPNSLGGLAWHSGSVHASHPACLGLILGPEIGWDLMTAALLRVWTVHRLDSHSSQSSTAESSAVKKLGPSWSHQAVKLIRH